MLNPKWPKLGFSMTFYEKWQGKSDVAAPGDWLRDPQRVDPGSHGQDSGAPGARMLSATTTQPGAKRSISRASFKSSVRGPLEASLAGDLASECLLAFSLTASRPKHEKTR